ncbi:MAG: hypothetical protein U0872_14625 [Planctomycetaceae bacterium]
MTTYGTWLRGDARGWVEEGRLYPPDPDQEFADRQRMKHDPFMLDANQLMPIGAAMGASLQNRLQQRILALTVQTWHVHFVVSDSDRPISEVVKCAKDAVRYLLRAGRPIWTDGYDKRFCFDQQTLWNRIQYVEWHNIERGMPPRPWPFIVPSDGLITPS